MRGAWLFNNIRRCAVNAAVKSVANPDSMTNHAATALRAGWRKKLNGALKCVEYISLASHSNFENSVVLVAAKIATHHH
jgi:hypothetical protein